jgi:hypothetical protein
MAYAINEGSETTMAADVYGAAAAPSSGQEIPWVGVAPGVAGALAPVSNSNPVHTASALEWVQVTVTLDTSAYASGDLLFDATAITGASLIAGGQCEIVCVSVLDEDDQGTAIDLYFTNLSTSWGSLNAAVNLTDAIGRGIQAYVPIAAADFKDLGGCRFAQPRVAQSVGVVCETSSSTSLYVAGVCASGTPTYTAAGIRINIGLKRS